MRYSFASCVLLAFPAFASTAKDEERVRSLVYDYAKCVVRARHDRAAEAIISNVDNAVIAKKYGDLISGDCLARVGGHVKLTFTSDLYRYALADALVNADYTQKVVTDFSDRLPLAHHRFEASQDLDAKLAMVKSKKKRAEIQERFHKATTAAWLSRYGECIVREDPVRSRLWLLTPPGGAEETSRIGDLRPAFGHCLDEGKLTFNKVTLRGAVALNYYRLANATPMAKAEKAN